MRDLDEAWQLVPVQIGPHGRGLSRASRNGAPVVGGSPRETVEGEGMMEKLCNTPCYENPN
jgi:hypothetical protein